MVLESERYGAGGTAPAVLDTRWGTGGGWIEARVRSTFPDGTAYGVRLIIVADAGGTGFTSYVANSFGSGLVYRGALRDDGGVEFETAVGGGAQRVRYTPRPDRGLDFRVEASADGRTFAPHSRATWMPRPDAFCAEGGD